MGAAQREGQSPTCPQTSHLQTPPLCPALSPLRGPSLEPNQTTLLKTFFKYIFKTNVNHFHEPVNRNTFLKIMLRNLKFVKSPYYPSMVYLERIPNSI
jgi:hypothetical protein